MLSGIAGKPIGSVADISLSPPCSNLWEAPLKLVAKALCGQNSFWEPEGLPHSSRLGFSPADPGLPPVEADYGRLSVNVDFVEEKSKIVTPPKK